MSVEDATKEPKPQNT